MHTPAAETREDPLAGARVRQVRQPAKDEVVLETYRPDTGAAYWLLSLHPEAPRLVRTFHRGHNPPQPPLFCQWLRSRLVGGTMGAPRRPEPQRLELPVRSAEGAYLLVLEQNGRDSNLLLLDESRRLLAALRHPALPGRRLRPGDPYAPPGRWRPVPRALLGPVWRAAGEGEAREADRRWRDLERAAALEQRRRNLLRAARRHLRRLERRRDKQEADRRKAAEAERYREWGELLKIHRWALQPRQREVRVPDEFDPERREVTIPLDPERDPAANIERLFQRYRKLREAVPHIGRRIRETDEALAGTRRLIGRVEAAATLADLEAVERSLAPAWRQALGLAARRRGGEGGGPAARGVMTRVSSDGYTIYVGRSGRENDRVTFRIGNGRDWWFHAQGIPGAHVVVRCPDGALPPPRTIREAAWLAAYYSRQRHEGALEVDYTQRKHVRKVRGGEPGQVTYSRSRTRWVPLDDAEAARVLDEGVVE